MNAGGDFSSWVKENGGDEDFLLVLSEFGFTSKLSLSNLNLDQLPEGTRLLERFNCGQLCLLRGLIGLAGTKQNYGGCIKNFEKVKRKNEIQDQ